jgi:hypothetical protein
MTAVGLNPFVPKVELRAVIWNGFASGTMSKLVSNVAALSRAVNVRGPAEDSPVVAGYKPSIDPVRLVTFVPAGTGRVTELLVRGNWPPELRPTEEELKQRIQA